MREKQNSSNSDGCKVSFILFVKMYFCTRIKLFFSCFSTCFFYSYSIYFYNKHRSSYLLSEIMKHKKHMNTSIVSL